MGYIIVRINDTATQELVAAEWPCGHLSHNDGASVPFIKRERLERLR